MTTDERNQLLGDYATLVNFWWAAGLRRVSRDQALNSAGS